MDSNLIAIIITCFALALFGLLIFGAVLIVRDTIRKRGNWGINLAPPACKQCGAPPPGVRVPANFSQAMWGGWTCPQCGLEVDKWGEAVNQQPFPAKWSAKLDNPPPPAGPADERYRKSSDDVQRGGDIRG